MEYEEWWNFADATVECEKSQCQIRDKRERRSSSDLVKVMIDNMILVIKLNASMLFVQDIHNHVAKYVKIPENWHSKNYAFEFVESISFILKTELTTELRKSAFQILIIIESISV